MIPTPEKVVPVIAPVALPIWASLRKGLAFADELQPDPADREGFFWAHSARYMARKELLKANTQPGVEGWAVRGNVPNCGIHLLLDDLHKIRVVRSFGGTTPHPGRNPRRRADWKGIQGAVQDQFVLDTEAELPPLSLIVDWTDQDGEPVVHIGLPRGEWGYQKSPSLHWRVRLPEAETDLAGLRFEAADDGGGVLPIDRSEFVADDR